MCALPRAIAVTTGYQFDSSSKRPRASVVSAARAPTASAYHVPDTASRASRPVGRRLRRLWTPRPARGQQLLCQQADACWLSRSHLRKGGF